MRIIDPHAVNRYFIEAFRIVSDEVNNCRHVAEGAVLVDSDGKIISTGYGKISVRNLCRNGCLRNQEGGKLCSRVHAVQMAVIHAVNVAAKLEGSRLYLVERRLVGGRFNFYIPRLVICRKCTQMLANYGIEVVLRRGKTCLAYSPKEIEEHLLFHFHDRLRDWKHRAVETWK